MVWNSEISDLLNNSIYRVQEIQLELSEVKGTVRFQIY